MKLGANEAIDLAQKILAYARATLELMEAYDNIGNDVRHISEPLGRSLALMSDVIEMARPEEGR